MHLGLATAALDRLASHQSLGLELVMRATLNHRSCTTSAFNPAINSTSDNTRTFVFMHLP